jgi:HAMP domain-containing protein
MSSPAQTPAQARWHRRARHALAHSLRVRLVALFLLLALAMAATFLFGMQKAFSLGWRDAARPLVVDYVDRLAAEIGSPPSIERAQALTRRLPVAVHISGPVVNWRSHPANPDQERRWNEANRWKGDEPRLLERSTADGHRIHFSLNVQVWQDQPRVIGWATLAVLLLLTGLAYLRVRRLLRPLDDIRAGALRFGTGDFAQRIPVRHPARPDELGELAATINTMGGDIRQMLDAKRALAAGHQPRAAQPADPRPPQHRAAARNPRRAARPRRPAARPGPDARPDHRPAGERTPGQPARRAAPASRWTWPPWPARSWPAWKAPPPCS